MLIQIILLKNCINCLSIILPKVKINIFAISKTLHLSLEKKSLADTSIYTARYRNQLG